VGRQSAGAKFVGGTGTGAGLKGNWKDFRWHKSKEAKNSNIASNIVPTKIAASTGPELYLMPLRAGGKLLPSPTSIKLLAVGKPDDLILRALVNEGPELRSLAFDRSARGAPVIRIVWQHGQRAIAKHLIALGEEERQSCARKTREPR
jgi:hypothetical protein